MIISKTGRIFINRNSKEMVHTCIPYDGEEYPKELWYEVDEMIAPAIVAFNKKGYETLYSCSGHIAKQITEKNDDPQYATFGANELYVTFRKTNPNKNLLKLLSNCEWDILKDFKIEKHNFPENPTFLFTLRHEFTVSNPDEFVNDTHQIADIYAEWIDINQKFYSLARKLPHKRQLNKSFRGKRASYFKNMAANTRARHERHNREVKEADIMDVGGSTNV